MSKNTTTKKKPSMEKVWTDTAKGLLLNHKIVEVRYLTKKEAEILDWYARSVVFVLDNGVMVFPSADDEGNGPGALFTSDRKHDVLPVIGLD